MKVRNFCLVLAVLAMSVSNASAQDFFWSLSNLGGGATQGDLDVNLTDAGLNIGDQATVFLYYNSTNSELDTGAGLDLTFSNNDVLDFVSAETFEFDVVLAGNTGVDLGDRWGDSFGPAGDVQANSITGLNAFTVVNGDGIVQENDGTDTFLDTGYDGNNNWLFGSVTVEIIGEGTTDVLISEGAIGIVNDGAPVAATFGGGTFTVGGAAIPEPTTAGVLAMGLIGLVARRRR
ncbi:MAG: PEP-CTERM sorting domain-containing protein [Planctomycetota bacterium]